MSSAKITSIDQFGDFKGAMYDFALKGDIVEKHVHDEMSNHITIVARGKLKAYSHDWEIEASSGQVIDFRVGEPHELVALEDNTRIFNILKNNIVEHKDNHRMVGNRINYSSVISDYDTEVI